MSDGAVIPAPWVPAMPPVLRGAVRSHPVAIQEALWNHILGGTSADWLSDWFKRAGTPVGATTIKTYRAMCREAGVCK